MFIFNMEEGKFGDLQELDLGIWPAYPVIPQPFALRNRFRE